MYLHFKLKTQLQTVHGNITINVMCFLWFVIEIYKIIIYATPAGRTAPMNLNLWPGQAKPSRVGTEVVAALR